MTRKESLLRLKLTLIRRRDALRQTLQGELEHFNTMEDRIVGDIADHAVDTDYGTINSQLAEVESRELEQIEHALERFRDRRYGVCELCDRTIPLARLKALPYATTCIRCQKQNETAVASDRLRDRWLRFDPAHSLRPALARVLTS